MGSLSELPGDIMKHKVKLPTRDKTTSIYPVKAIERDGCLILEAVPIRTKIETFKKKA